MLPGRIKPDGATSAYYCRESMAGIHSDPYSVAKPTGVCASSGQPIDQGDVYVATLAERQGEEGFARYDYSLDAWERGDRPARLIGFWRARQPDANEKPKPFIDDASLQELFEQLEGTDEPTKQSFRFLLGLVLMRKRLIRQVGRTKHNGTKILLVKPRGAPTEQEPMQLVDSGMDESAVADATDQFSAILRGES